MSRETRLVHAPQTDQRFIAEATTETGVTLRAMSDWKPSHWAQEDLRRIAEAELRSKFKQADLLNVKVGAIRIYREVRRSETVETTWTSRKIYAEVAR